MTNTLRPTGQDQLDKLGEAITQARALIREAHETAQALRDEIRPARQLGAELQPMIRATVQQANAQCEAAVMAVADQARAVIDGLTERWEKRDAEQVELVAQLMREFRIAAAAAGQPLSDEDLPAALRRPMRSLRTRDIQ